MNIPQQVTEIEIEKRMALAQHPEFVKFAIECAKKLGVTAKEWNENKVATLMLFANKAIAMAQDNGLDTFGVKNEKLSIFF